MLLLALDEKKLITTFQAQKGKNYTCPDCGQSLRLRAGIRTQHHFYHHQGRLACRTQGRSLRHLAVQNRIASQLEGAILERRFPEIGRIADVCWESKKIIFEVQCSPITTLEVQSRNEDYRSLGYEVVWILHTDRYGKRPLGDLERSLVGSPHYYTDINSQGRGQVIDWLPPGNFKSAKRSINISKPLFRDIETASLEGMLRFRQQQWPLYFEGDILHRCLEGDKDLRDFIRSSSLMPKEKWVPLLWVKWFLYRTQQRILHYLLESLCD